MASLESRIQKLARIFTQCSECGSAPLGSLGYEDLEIVWDDGWEVDEDGNLVPASLEEEPEPEFCPECGEPTHLIIHWDLDEEEEREAREARRRSLRGLQEGR